MESGTNEKRNNYLASIGAEIRMIRSAQGHTQKSFARVVGLASAYIGGIERGERNLSSLNLIKIAKALSVPVGEFFKGIE